MPRKGTPRKAAIQTYVTDETKAAFAALAKKQGGTEADFLRAIIQHVVKTGGGNTDPIQEPQNPGKRVQVKIELNRDENAELLSVAKAAGLRRTSWLVHLLRAHLYRAQQFTNPEIDGLYESNRQIAAVGRNLNQIARNLNANMNASQSVTVELIEDLTAELKQHRKHVSALVNANLDRWGVEK